PCSHASLPFSSFASRLIRYLHSFLTRRSSDLLANSVLTVAKIPTLFSGVPPSVGLVVQSSSPRPITASRSPRSGLRCCLSSVCRSEEHTSELQSRFEVDCRLLLANKKQETEED